MTLRKQVTALVRRKQAVQKAAEPTVDEALTPYDKLLRAAERGQFEALVRAARPAEPPVMVTPQQREAALRASGRWPADRHAPKPAPRPAPVAEPIPGPPPPELTPNEQYIADHCRWGRRSPHDYAHRRAPSFCQTDYDPLADDEGETSC